MIIHTAEQMENLGQQIGRRLRGGETIELIGDVGAGKTTLTRGLAKGLGIDDNITSPTFTISCNYDGRDGLSLCHYDFYRLTDVDIVAMELAETIHDSHCVNVVEWGDDVRDVLPADHVTIRINYLPGQGRQVDIQCPKSRTYLLD